MENITVQPQHMEIWVYYDQTQRLIKSKCWSHVFSAALGRYQTSFRAIRMFECRYMYWGSETMQWHMKLLCYTVKKYCLFLAQCKTAVTPVLRHWSYCSFALSHRHMFNHHLTCHLPITSQMSISRCDRGITCQHLKGRRLPCSIYTK